MGDSNDLLRNLVERALDEDAVREDVTTGSLVDQRLRVGALIVARAGGIVSGHRPSAAVFRAVDRAVRYTEVSPDGSRVEPEQVVATIEGPCAAILSGERTALNFLQHLSGIATMTARFVEAVAGTGTVILDTRKTMPGLRALEKEAVIHGGGRNHRFDLRDRILVKENHITAAGGLASVLAKLGKRRLGGAEIEVSTLGELRLLKPSPPGRIMLDNFTPEMTAAALAELERWEKPRPEIEVSGGVNIENIVRYAGRGVDFISVGALTASASALDLSLVVTDAAVDDD